MNMANRSRITFLSMAIALATALPAAAAGIDSPDFTPDDLFQLKKVWTVDLVFQPEQW